MLSVLLGFCFFPFLNTSLLWSRKVRHKNVVQFIGACTRPPSLCIVTGNRTCLYLNFMFVRLYAYLFIYFLWIGSHWGNVMCLNFID